MRLLRIMASPVAGALIVFSGTTAMAQSYDKAFESAMNNYQHHLSTCAAYFSVVGFCTGTTKNDGLREKLSAASEQATMKATLVARKIGMSDLAVAARILMAQEGMVAETDRTCINASVLLHKYGARCVRMMNKPPEEIVTSLMLGQAP